MGQAMREKKEPVTPAIGMGCTVCWHSDTKAATVIWISASGKQLEVQEDHSTVTKPAKQYGDTVEYEFSPNPEGRTWKFSLRKGNVWREVKGSLGLGLDWRRTYTDPHF